MKTPFLLLLFMALLALSCEQKSITQEPPPNPLLQMDWAAFCVIANRIVDDPAIDKVNWDATFFERMYQYRPFARSRVTVAFIDQCALIGTPAHDHQFFEMFAYEAGGFDFSCPALSWILPVKTYSGCISCDNESTGEPVDSLSGEQN